MLTHSLACAAAAALCWPPVRGSAARLGVLAPSRERRGLPKPRKAFAFGLVPLLFVVPPMVWAAGALLGLAGWRQWHARRRSKSGFAMRRAMAEALHAMVVDLRAGATPALAAESAAADAPRPVAEILDAVAGAARLGGNLDETLATVTTAEPLSAARRRLVRAWSLSQRHGLPLADLLDAVRQDITAELRFTSQSEAAMSGPRASAMVLAALPVFGLLLGEGMGAHPTHILFATPSGNALLLLGTALITTGAAWSAHLTRRGAPR
ncbi:type II secretion system F family protein [Amycolatopsis sp. ATCC 39116]|uniref:type II secretion system F family protein n=1 Tax=Amycolatopsis sp. (strain ATCC 39116 / 75iv2) TaxID=385957 RepID=UPI00026289F1|nr:type II secretion system F family protein [Amycolatopsis sp. ATCC 39116]